MLSLGPMQRPFPKQSFQGWDVIAIQSEFKWKVNLLIWYRIIFVYMTIYQHNDVEFSFYNAAEQSLYQVEACVYVYAIIIIIQLKMINDVLVKMCAMDLDYHRCIMYDLLLILWNFAFNILNPWLRFPDLIFFAYFSNLSSILFYPFRLAAAREVRTIPLNITTEQPALLRGWCIWS